MYRVEEKYLGEKSTERRAQPEYLIVEENGVPENEEHGVTEREESGVPDREEHRVAEVGRERSTVCAAKPAALQ